MDKSDSAHPSELQIAIQQGDWSAYRDHVYNHLSSANAQAAPTQRADEREQAQRAAFPIRGRMPPALPCMARRISWHTVAAARAPTSA